jgi:hypothetical protein
MIVIDDINRQLEHYSYYVRQIVQLRKWLKNEDWESLPIPKDSTDYHN